MQEVQDQDQNPENPESHASTTGATSSAAGPSKRRKRVSLVSHIDQIESWVRQGATDDWIARALGTTPSSIQSFRSRSGIVRGGTGRAGSRLDYADPGKVSATTSVYEGVLEHGEEEGYGLWLDPAVADDPAFKKGFSGVEDVEVFIQRDRIVLRPMRPMRPLRAADGGTAVGAMGDVEQLNEFQPGLAGFEDLEEAARSLPASNRERGVVKFFEPAKGYGFILRPDEAGGGEIFFHKSQIGGGEQVSMLAANLEVSYEVGSNQRGLVAEDVKVTG